MTLVAGQAVPPRKPADAPAKPANPAKAAEPASPQTITVDQRSCDFAADYSAEHAGRAVLVMQRGQVIYERYDNGWRAGLPHPLASGTKSFTGVTAAIAIKEGLISSWDELVSGTITEWKTDPIKKDITVRHLLTLSSGLDPADDTLGTLMKEGGRRLIGPGTNSRRDQERGKAEVNDKFKQAVITKSVAKPGERFEYGPSHYFAFGEFLQRKLNASTLPASEKTVEGYMKARLFTPIGMTAFRIGKDAAGNPNLPGGAVLTAREWAKFGQLVLQQGTWYDADGKPIQVVDKDLLADCFRPSKTNPVYGLTWWLLRDDAGQSSVADGGEPRNLDSVNLPLKMKILSREAGAPPRPDGKPWEVYMAAGLGKQRLFILPQEDLVIVRFAENKREGMGFENGEFLIRLLGLKPAAPASSDPAPTKSPTRDPKPSAK